MNTLHVAQNHPSASDANPGSDCLPFLTIQAAASLAGPGDRVEIHEGIYRERVSPVRGGVSGSPILFEAAAGEHVSIRGSDLVAETWQSVPGKPCLNRLSLTLVPLGTAAYAGICDAATYGDFNPYQWQYNRKSLARPLQRSLGELQKKIQNFEKKIADTDGSGTELVNWKSKLEALRLEFAQRSHKENPRLYTTLGQIFDRGRELREVEYISDLEALPNTWLVSPDGTELWAHFENDAGREIRREVEITTRHTVFSPLNRGLGYITLRNLTIEHGASYFPSWGDGGWAQSGLLSTRGGHHWTVQNCTIRLAKAIGMDCGSEGASENAEGGPPAPQGRHEELKKTTAGYHLIENNHISDNGHCGIAGIGHHGTRLLYNYIERNNSLGLTAPWWEFGGVKFHHCYDALIEGNIVRDNDAHGIWLDNQFQGTRVTRNVIVNNLWSGINVEYGRGPCMIDHNVIAYTRQGDGIYGHDVAEMTIAHNLLYANAGFGVWLAYCTNRVPMEDACSDHRILNNLILGNKIGAVSLPIPWAAAKNNISDGNLLMGSGQILDEGSGPFPPFFQFNNKSHCAQFPRVCPGEETQTSENVAKNLLALMDAAKVPEALRPNLQHWDRHFMVTWEVWQAVLGNDLNSRSCRAVRDGLQSRNLGWTFSFDGSEKDVLCQGLPELSRDFYGRAIPAKPLPGPFQNLLKGEQTLVLVPRKL